MATIVHHLNQSRSQRVLFVLEELGRPYEIRFYQRNPKTLLAPPELKRIHPLGKSPVVEDDGDVLAETGLILDTLIDRHGAGTTLRPEAGTKERLRYDYYLHYAEGSLMPLGLLSLVFSRLPSQAPFPIRPVAKLLAAGVRKQFVGPNIGHHLRFLNDELDGRPWFAGQDFTGADAMMSFPVQALNDRAGLGRYPNLADWLRRLEARPAWTRATEKGGTLTFEFG
ncbi:glutathione S-transferase [Acetobacteraceae bacterium KSS8]|uniref:Glutathione S-transferase n=1 Tax=Endosaccharibacter trunci TaxID=2812733 RepID=A0ABT1WB92_9PROT|nr:glutathione S-transferase [Acetobacteraceae bacterium KSS8]